MSCVSSMNRIAGSNCRRLPAYSRLEWTGEPGNPADAHLSTAHFISEISRHDYGDPFGRPPASGRKQTPASSNRRITANPGHVRPRLISRRRCFRARSLLHHTSSNMAEIPQAWMGRNATLTPYRTTVFGIRRRHPILGRVERSKLGNLDGTDWEFFGGGNGLSDGNWTPDVSKAKPIFEDPLKLGETGAVYLRERQRYMMITWYYPDGTGHADGAAHRTIWNFHESPHPWGTMDSDRFALLGSKVTTAPAFVPSFSRPKEFMFSRRVTLATSGPKRTTIWR